MSFGPQFAPSIMSIAFVSEQIAALAARTGICHADRCDWIVPLIIEADQSGTPCDRQIMKDARFDDCLTEIGRTDRKLAAAAITLCAPFARTRDKDRQTAMELDRPNRLSAGPPNRCCAAATAMNKTVFGIGEEPPLPLPECDAWHCACMFVGHYQRRSAAAAD